MENEVEKTEVTETRDYESEIADLKKEVERLKVSGSKANSDCAEWKRKFRETQSSEERAKAELEETRAKAEEEKAQALADIIAERDALLKEKTLNKYKSHYLSLGYDDELASKTANAKLDGDEDTVFANEKTFQELYKKSIQEEFIKQTPKPTSGMPVPSETDKTTSDLRRWSGLK